MCLFGQVQRVGGTVPSFAEAAINPEGGSVNDSISWLSHGGEVDIMTLREIGCF